MFISLEDICSKKNVKNNNVCRDVQGFELFMLTYIQDPMPARFFNINSFYLLNKYNFFLNTM